MSYYHRLSNDTIKAFYDKIGLEYVSEEFAKCQVMMFSGQNIDVGESITFVVNVNRAESSNGHQPYIELCIRRKIDDDGDVAPDGIIADLLSIVNQNAVKEIKIDDEQNLVGRTSLIHDNIQKDIDAFYALFDKVYKLIKTVKSQIK